MPWVRLDDDFYNHPKVIKAGPLGIAMHVAGLCYCNHYLTDGFIPFSIVPGLLNLDGLGMRMWNSENGISGGGEDAAWNLIVEDLVTAGLWEQAEGGYAIHDYLDYQPSRAQVMAEREANAKRQEEWRKTHRDGKGKYNAVTNSVSNASYNTAPNPNPNPNPIPNTKETGAPAPAASDSPNDKTPKPKATRERDPLFDAIAEVCCVDPSVKGNGAKIGKARAALADSEPPYSPAEVLAFGKWWNSDEWRVKKGPPTVWKLTEQIGLVRNGNGNGKGPHANNPTGHRVEYTAEELAQAERINAARRERGGVGL